MAFLEIAHLHKDYGPVEVSSSKSSPDAVSVRGLMIGAVEG